MQVPLEETARRAVRRYGDQLKKLAFSAGPVVMGLTIGCLGALGPLPREGRLTSVFQTITFFWTGRGAAAAGP